MNTTKRLMCLSGLVVAVCACSLSLSGTFDTGTPAVFAAAGGASISDVMVVAHGGKTSLLNQLKAAVRAPGPPSDKEWKAVRAHGAVLATLATDVLGKRLPKKGKESSWNKQVAIYADAAKKVAAAAAEQDLAAATGAVRKLARTCSGCHKPHK